MPGTRALATPDPPLSDGHVALRLWRPEDVDQITAACQDAEIQRYLPLPRDYQRSHAEDYVARTHRDWEIGWKAAFAIVEPDDPDRVLGAINLAISGSVGNAAYWVTPEARGRGVATAALRLVTGWALGHLGLGVVMLEIRPHNDASIRVAERAGFHQVGTIDVNLVTGDKRGLIFVRLASDLPAA